MFVMKMQAPMMSKELKHGVRKLKKYQQISSDWSLTSMETNLLPSLGSLIVFEDVP